MLTCSRCGTRPDEWAVDEHDVPHEFPYEPFAHRCPGCFEISGYEQKMSDSSRQGATIMLRRVTEEPTTAF